MFTAKAILHAMIAKQNLFSLVLIMSPASISILKIHGNKHAVLPAMKKINRHVDHNHKINVVKVLKLALFSI